MEWQITPLLCLTLSLMIAFGSSSSSTFTNETDPQALLAIKDSITRDPFLVLQSWNKSTPFCHWQGVTCSNQHQRVTNLNLSSLGLAGSLSPHIGNLTFLTTLDLTNNSFFGEIPQETGRLFLLQNLLLTNNSFQGELPTNLTHCLNLRSLCINNNNLRGKIPVELGSLPNLWKLDLGSNNFTGNIPVSIGNLSNLLVLSVTHNNLDGSNPLVLGRLSNLMLLLLSFNNFSGVVPTSLYNISSLTYFSLTDNLLEGSLPQNLGFTLPNLQYFHFAINKFHGHIPSSIGNASGLVRAEFSKNYFTGPLPAGLGTLCGLQGLICYGNKLGDSKGTDLNNFLTLSSNCSSIEILDLGSNSFKGSLPPSIGNLSTLTWFAVDGNSISGSIPLGIVNLADLSVLYLGYNMLTGRIPDSIGKLSKLEWLFLETNSISGEIPPSIGNLTSLGTLSLAGNMIEGSIPVSLGQCTNLRNVYLQNNGLTGAIPQQLFGLYSVIVLSLSQNHLTGSLPFQVGNLKNLGQLTVSGNNLSGEIPTRIGSCQVLEYLYMSGNHFEGSIPPSFEQLKGLQVLDVSHNNLSGQIPSFLGEFNSLQLLNLSYNTFDGEVPTKGAFTNISAFSIVGNKKLCGGIEVLQLPTCPTKSSNKKKGPFSTGKLVLVVISFTIVVLVVCLSAILFRIRKSRRGASSTSPLQNHHLQLSYGELLQATNGFSSANLIGKGRYSSVYKGILNTSDQIIAVKVLNLYESGANKSFISECETLKNIRHRNLVKLITSCSSIDYKGNDFKALVFELMANGSLESWLHPSLSEPHDPKSFNFVQMLNIAIDIASALEYLHHHCEMAFIHCDLKPSNILLDNDLCAHVADFGLARIFSTTANIASPQQSSSIVIRGTIGYVAPEYGMSEEVSMEGDMYSYGVLLLEMFTGKRPTESMFTADIGLRSYVKMSLPEKVMEVVDSRIVVEEEDEEDLSRIGQSRTTKISKLENSLVSVLQVGISCSAELASERLNAKDVLRELHKIRKCFLYALEDQDVNNGS